MSSLLTLPPEVLDTILTCLYTPSDLLSLSLADRTLHTLVSPEHLSYRSVRLAYFDTPSLRDLLESTGRVVGLVQRMRLECPAEAGTAEWEEQVGGYRWIGSSEPQALASYSDKDKEDWCRTFLQAAGRMRTLVTLELYITELADFLRFVPFLVSLLSTCPSLARLVVSGDGFVNGDLFGLKDCLLALYKLGYAMRRLTHFSWCSDDYFSSPMFHALSKSLSSCGELEYLDLRFEYDPRILSDFPPAAKSLDLWTARWPYLRTLELDRIRLDESTGAFLREHPLLEKLTLNRISYAWEATDFDMPPDALPNLRELWWPIHQYTDALMTLVRPLPDGRRRPLESLSMVTLTTFENYDPTAGTNHTEDGYFSPEVFNEFCTQVAQLPTLVHLGMENHRASGIDKIVQLSSTARNVRDVVLQLRSWPSATIMNVLAKALGGFQSLTQLHFLNCAPPEHDTWQSTLSELAKSCASLNHVNGWIKRADRWIPSHKSCRTCFSCSVDPEAYYDSECQRS